MELQAVGGAFVSTYWFGEMDRDGRFFVGWFVCVDLHVSLLGNARVSLQASAVYRIANPATPLE